MGQIKNIKLHIVTDIKTHSRWQTVEQKRRRRKKRKRRQHRNLSPRRHLKKVGIGNESQEEGSKENLQKFHWILRRIAVLHPKLFSKQEFIIVTSTVRVSSVWTY